MSFFLLLLLFLFCALTQAEAVCYWPSGAATDSTWLPCGQGTSNCCTQGDACLSNGLCFNANGMNYRGACTDASWQSGSSSRCPQFCNDDHTDGPSNLYVCPPDNVGTTNWWCGQDFADFCNETATSEFLDYPSGRFEKVASNAASSITGSVPPTLPTSVTAKTVTAKPSPSASHSHPSTADLVGAGLGIGVPLGILTVVLGVLFYREHNRRILAESGVSGAVSNSQTGLVAQPDTAKELDAPRKPLPAELGGIRPPELG